MTGPHDIRAVETRTHGRYLVRAPPHTRGPWPLLVGFHGYGESAERHLALLDAIPEGDAWLCVAVQALHPFYSREREVVANWMTRQDREQAIEDNIRYVGVVLDAVRREYPTRPPVVFAGFSQGVAMAYRAAAHYPAAGVIALAGDVPPDVAAITPSALPPVLIGRGVGDTWYTEAEHDADAETLLRLGVPVEHCVFEGAHAWTPDFAYAAGGLLTRVLREA